VSTATLPMPRRILQITSYPPPRAGWGVRVEYLKKQLEQDGHECVVLNIGSSRAIPSTEYETVLGGWDYFRKVWSFTQRGFIAHVHVNGASPKGFVLAIVAELVNLLFGRRCYLTFHAGIEQVYFPRAKAPALVPLYWVLFGIPKAIVCNSEEVKAKIVEYGVKPEKIVPIPAFSRQYLESGEGALPENLARFYASFDEIVFCYTKIRPLFFPVTTVEGFARVAERRPQVGLVMCGVAGHMEAGLWTDVQNAITKHGLHDRIAIVEDLSHDVFLTALGRARVCLRTHLSDGVCSSVLESLAMGVPVVANENHNRPSGVLTYPPEDVAALASTLCDALERRDQIAATLQRPEVRDTVAEEVRLLTT
jgi:glycosyltransferase involved in cell wall biosynthesis